MRTRATALALSTHPGPALAVTVIAVVLGIGIGLDAGRVVVLGVAVLLNQASVGLSNDWLDAARDRAVGRADKPVALGHITPGAVRNAAVVTGAASIGLSFVLGWPAAVTQAIFLVSAWSYNLGLKKTPLSVLPYIISFGLLPELVALARPEVSAAQPWALGVGALLGIAAHFANVLPDLEDDRATGVRGLPHRMGRRASGIVTCLSLLGAAFLEFLGTNGFAPALAGLIASAVIAVAGLARAGHPSRWQFRLIIVAALVDVVVLALAGSRILVPGVFDFVE